jgi:tungstate transport system substrate-binding protein
MFLFAMTAQPFQFGSTAGDAKNAVLRLATTTSVVETGLAAFIFPDFERKHGCKVDAIAVGTGQALEVARRGDADVVIVHARKLEDQFIADGHAKERREIMFNDFVVVGPTNDPARAAAKERAADIFKAVAGAKALFCSRGDRSGTHTKELAIWAAAGIEPSKSAGWYNVLGQGSGPTLLAANETGAYTLADRGTFLKMKARLASLKVVLGGANLHENKDRDLINCYAILPVNADKHRGVNAGLAAEFVDWMLSPETQATIGRFGVEQFGQPLFYPAGK